MNFSGGIIWERRTIAGLNQAELAARIGLSPAHLSRLENGERYRLNEWQIQACKEAIDLEEGEVETLRRELGSALFDSEPIEQCLEYLDHLRESGQIPGVIKGVDNLNEYLGRQYSAAPRWAKASIGRFWVKGLNLRLVTVTSYAWGYSLEQLVNDDLLKLRELEHHLLDSDQHDRELAQALPLWVWRLSGRPDWAAEGLDHALQVVEDPMVYAICLYDRFLIAALKGDFQAHNVLSALTDHIVGSNRLPPAREARVLLGRAISSLRLGLHEGQADLNWADRLLESRYLQGEPHFFTQAEVALAKLEYALATASVSTPVEKVRRSTV